MNIYEISQLAGVSIATVSRVLNNSPNVSPKTKAKIEKIINDNKYAPTKPGKKRRPGRTIGILCNSIQSPRSAILLEQLLGALHNLNYDTFLVNCGNDLNEKRIAIQHYADLNVAAIIIEGTNFLSYDRTDNAYISQIADKIPVILLNSYMEHPNIHSILCDEGELIFSLTENFIKQRKTNILFLFSSMSAYCAPLLEAFSHAFYVHNLDTGPEQIHLCSNDYRDSYKYIDTLLKSGREIDAIITTDDIMALGAVNAAHDNGLKTPSDIEICGMGDTYIADITNLSSINCKEREITEAALNTLSGIISNTHAPSRVNFPAELIKRRTLS